MIGRNFRAKEKAKILELCENENWSTSAVKKVARISNCHYVTIYGWRKQYDGSMESLQNKAPNNFQPRQHTAEQTEILKQAIENYSGIGRMELYGRLRLEMGYIYSIRTMDREIKRQKFIVPFIEKIKVEKQPYDTPTMIGVKWQIDVKYVPAICLKNIEKSFFKYRDGVKWYQYTCIDEASRKRFIYTYENISAKNTVDFMKRCIIFFGYKPLIVQTDNGTEFCKFSELNEHKAHRKNSDGTYVHGFTEFLRKQNIKHYLIKVATPRHNGKVERSHRVDNEEFYSHYTFDKGFNSLEQMRICQKEWLYRYNTKRCMSVLNYKTPQMVEDILMSKLQLENGNTSYIDLERGKKNEKDKKVVCSGVIQFMPRNENWAFANRAV